MKQIKKIVLKDATKLTNSEMKKIRGGVNDGPPDGPLMLECSATCYHTTGALAGEISIECAFEHICIESSEYGAGYVQCINPNASSYKIVKELYCNKEFPII
ncbi:MAG: TIGR04149 family rSAM-modified RiPP [Bacteroidaceae bacterium]|nr:TIGR04149 family rSAM-modified RiPP [Bacteroidaceae bacterium]